MAKNTRRNNKKRIEELLKEIAVNDEILKRNLVQHQTQVQIGLLKKGFPQGAGMYSSLIDKLKDEISELKLKLDSGFEVISPVFKFQKMKQWIDLQNEIAKKSLKAIQGNVDEIKKNVDEVEKEIVIQDARIKERRVQILQELEELGHNISELKDQTPDYIQ